MICAWTGHIQGGGRLVNTINLGLTARARLRQPADIDAGQFMGKRSRCCLPAQRAPAARSLAAIFGFGQYPVGDQRLGDDLFYLEARAERGERVLENDLHLLAHLAHLVAFERIQVATVEEHLAGVGSSSADDAPQGVLPQPIRRPDERLARGDLQIHTIESVDIARPAREPAARQAEVAW